MNRHRLELRKEAEEQTTSSSSANTNKDQEAEKEVEKKSGESDVDLEEMLEKSPENTEPGQSYEWETDLNNVQNDVAETVENTEAESNNKMETDLNAVQKEVAETVEPSDENRVDNVDSNVQTDMDTDIQEDNAKDNKESETTKQEEENIQMDDTDKPTSKCKDTSAKENMHNVQKDMDMPRKPIVAHSSANKAASKLVHKVKVKVKGSWEFVNNERAECAKRTKCYLCGAQKDTLQALESYTRRKHKSYLTRAGRNKHEMYHTIGYRFKCKDCKKRFMFESQFEEHRSVHTGENRYICRKKGCDKHYGSTRACDYHERQHNVKPMYCDYHETPKSEKCNQEFFSKQHYQQHYQGLHGDGWDAKCGKNYAWLAQRTAHEKECAACGKIKKEEKARK